MRKTQFLTLLVAAMLIPASVVQADATSSVWSTGVAEPADGAFGTPGSVAANKIDATITTGSSTANVSLSASNGSFLRTTGAPNITNNELAPFFENDVPLTNLSFMSDVALLEVDVLFHNVWNQGGTNDAGTDRINYVGNFEVTYENGTIVSNALPTIRSINNDSPFTTDLLGGTLQPTEIDSSFDGGNNLQLTGPSFDPGNGAPLGSYLFDPSVSVASETQGFGILSFDQTVHGGITKIDFTWVGNTEGVNTAFVGFAGQVPGAAVVPEPTAVGIFMLSGVAVVVRRRRTQR